MMLGRPSRPRLRLQLFPLRVRFLSDCSCLLLSPAVGLVYSSAAAAGAAGASSATMSNTASSG